MTLWLYARLYRFMQWLDSAPAASPGIGTTELEDAAS